MKLEPEIGPVGVMDMKLFSTRTPMRRLLVAVALSLSASTLAFGQSFEQWSTLEKSMADLIAEDFAVKNIIVNRVRPVTTDAIQYFLIKDKRLVRCTETVVHKRGITTTASLICAELSQPKKLP
jgi:hypothetical protein